ncbi:hypothetical protein TMES_09125 [Thalassospira mesophila]|uniref:SxtJ n=2 Tax=Thalassospira mesophila TaxID=1293891 RepID=A0A1Y2L2U5_9PROT|nr:hypothetical protein TMES_09125 [Thalassospira mesophila]
MGDLMVDKKEENDDLSFLRKKSIAMCCGFSVLSGISYFNNGFAWPIFTAAAVIIIMLGIFYPSKLSNFFYYIQKLHKKIGVVAFFVVFVFVITPMSWVLRALRLDDMTSNPSESPITYWETENIKDPNDIDFTKQF